VPAKSATAAATIDLFALALEAGRSAYAPYSKFYVGAAVETESGGHYSGCNVENVAFPAGSCAERNALAAATLAEGPGMRVRRIAVVAYNNGQLAPCSPCGCCRQAIVEQGPSAEVEFYDHDLQQRRVSAAKLLPWSFTFAAG
jgi:cytidine deaminase